MEPGYVTNLEKLPSGIQITFVGVDGESYFKHVNRVGFIHHSDGLKIEFNGAVYPLCWSDQNAIEYNKQVQLDSASESRLSRPVTSADIEARAKEIVMPELPKTEETAADTAVETAAPATEAASKKAKPKKAAKKEAAPKAEKAKPAAKKADKKPAPKAAPKKVEKKNDGGLRKPQIRILKCLAKSTKTMDRKTVAAKAPVDQAACVEYLGSHDAKVRAANDKKHFPSLVTLGLVKFGPHEEEGGVAYEITAKGKALAEKL